MFVFDRKVACCGAAFLLSLAWLVCSDSGLNAGLVGKSRNTSAQHRGGGMNRGDIALPPSTHSVGAFAGIFDRGALVYIATLTTVAALVAHERGFLQFVTEALPSL